MGSVAVFNERTPSLLFSRRGFVSGSRWLEKKPRG